MAASSSPNKPEPYVDRSTKRGIGYGVYWILALVVCAIVVWALTRR